MTIKKEEHYNEETNKYDIWLDAVKSIIGLFIILGISYLILH